MIYQFTKYDMQYHTSEYEYYSFESDGYKEYRANDIIKQNGVFVSKTGKYILHSELKNYSSDIFGSVMASTIYWKTYYVKIYRFSQNTVTLSIESNCGDCLFSSKYSNFNGYHGYRCITKDEAEKINNFYKDRNKQRQEEYSSINQYINDYLLSIAQNLLDNIDESTFLNLKCLTHCSLYSGSVTEYRKYKDYILTVSDGYGLKGNEKKTAIAKSKAEAQKLRDFIELFNGFAEIIMEEQNINVYFARAIAWEAVKQKLVEKYSLVWEREYEGSLNETFDEVLSKSDTKEHAINDYIKSILECSNINFEEIRVLLIYFLFSKESEPIQDIGGYFPNYNNLFDELKKQVHKQDIKAILKNKSVKKSVKYTIDDIDLMTGLEFEKFIELLFQKLGYTTQTTPKSRDQGIDVIAKHNNAKIGIQAKCYSSSVGNSAIQEVVAGGNYYLCNKLIVVTNNYFTSPAKELAASNNVILWDREFLKMKIKEIF